MIKGLKPSVSYYMVFKKEDKYFSKRKPIAYSNKATFDTLQYLVQGCCSYEEILKMLKYDKDGRDVVNKYMELNVPFKEFLLVMRPNFYISKRKILEIREDLKNYDKTFLKKIEINDLFY